MTARTIAPLPLELDQIDAEWLTAALRTRAPEVTVTGFRFVDVIRGTSTKVRIALELDNGGVEAGIPSTVILKGGFEPHSFALGFMHEQEARFYRDLQPTLGLRSPTCYFADFDPDSGQGIVIMEDLVARGVRFCDPLEPQSVEQVRRRLESLAAYHAQTWNSPGFAAGGRYDWYQEIVPALQHYMNPFFEPATWSKFVRLPRGAAASVHFHDPAWAAAAVAAVIRYASGLPVCLVHADTHLGNLYEEPDGTPGFFDSLPIKAPSLVEVTYHVTCALDPVDRRECDRELVQHYLNELSRHGVDAPPIDDAMTQFAVFLLHGFLIFLVNESEYQAESVNTAYTARFSAAMIDHGTKSVLELLGSSQ